ncbi:MAG: hypothetical protein A3D65_00860 [Candidatus Lloydbacteria bacterium RIFCSPHIGHO2_02_FULL_50_13]|uniref:Uncharacterized protein n=1 Tax=Candidatus Lloydbacteria bacterium RIFCSPHIGHO2_02_FULL_50_13 TaxID=1798661 RepID=A0A1G2D268_9BACT|nr:MAG: hypothetical protein A3D65_00860 [Candidatus Lloydbacteria bacterium RIFCSPHIGHO2_02_FULL_50_13]
MPRPYFVELTTSSENRVENADFTQRPSGDVDKDSYPYLETRPEPHRTCLGRVFVFHTISH